MAQLSLFNRKTHTACRLTIIDTLQVVQNAVKQLKLETSPPAFQVFMLTKRYRVPIELLV